MTANFLHDLQTNLHPFETTAGTHVLVADGSRVYDLSRADFDSLTALLRGDAAAETATRGAAVASHLLPADGARQIGPAPLAPPPLQALSLNVAQACNMSCGYCYAGRGTFGGDRRLMTADTARASVDRLLAESAPGSDVVVGFMGGEPLLARGLVHDITRYAAVAAQERQRGVRFSITTNGTLLTPDDVRLFAEFAFTVTISIDGPPPVHRRLRMLNDGGDSYSRLLAGLKLFAQHGRPRHLTARVTVTPITGNLCQLLDHVIGLGFDDVGFAPVLVSPDPDLAFSERDLAAFLDQMIACGQRTLDHVCRGERYPFANFETAIREIHRGTHRPYPCGAGASYLSVGAEGDLYACHRLIDDPQFAMGTVREGADRARRTEHLRLNHVDRQEPCRSCWARYLCGGGCYHEVNRRGRIACDYIRGWLDFCLQAYVELQDTRPEYFQGEARHEGR